ncbi:MAG: GNAT family N-acetyltransferase [Alphaproteobacteria bacterium]|nr:GNAT family N-acetyltransferase [Alphaproteobacteria bacterium]
MDCACGHHHQSPVDQSGQPVPLSRPLVTMHGRLICADMGQMLSALDLLPDHVQQSRAEPGCLRFDVGQGDDPLIWSVDEIFADEDAFAAHQVRTADSQWARDSCQIGRDYHRYDVMPLIRLERPQDEDALDRLLTRSFGGPSEARLVRALRAAGDLAVSVVAHVQGLPVGHVALSPLQAARPAYALAPLAVHPALQGRGLGHALVQAALAAAGECPVVVLGDPAFYGKAGFRPAELSSSYVGLMIHGALPRNSAVTHAAAFATL